MNLLQKLISALGLGLCLVGAARGLPLPESPPVRTTDVAPAPLAFGATSEAQAALVDPLRRGLWPLACTRATAALAGAQPMVEALGIFALCAALHGDAEALGRAQQRLKEAEASPYYAILAQSVAALRATQTSRALAGLQGLLATHPADGLTRYFLGEAEYTAGDEAAARQSFSAALTAWPLHAPAMMALSQLEAGGEASEAALARAIALMEQATKIDPGNRTYWQWLAALCERAGQTGRAQAIALQRLQAWQPPAPR